MDQAALELQAKVIMVVIAPALIHIHLAVEAVQVPLGQMVLGLRLETVVLDLTGNHLALTTLAVAVAVEHRKVLCGALVVPAAAATVVITLTPEVPELLILAAAAAPVEMGMWVLGLTAVMAAQA